MLVLRNWRRAIDEASAFEQRCSAEHDVIPGGIAQRRRVEHVQHPLVGRNPAAEPENEHRDHEAPEIQLLAMPEGVLGRGLPLAQLHADKQAARRFPQSTIEWIPSDSIAELPVIPGRGELGDRNGRPVRRDRAVDGES